MDLFCLLSNQTFVRDFRCGIEPLIALTQNNDQDLRLFLLQENRPGTGWPFCYDPSSGGEGYIAVASLRDVRGFPVTLASAPLDIMRDGFSGILQTNTQEVADFLAGFATRDVAFCVDLVDGSGHKTAPFRRIISLRAIDNGTVASVPGIIYNSLIDGLTGGGETNLDGQVTAGRSEGTLWIVIRIVGGERVKSEWELVAGTAAEDEDAGIIRPDDYDDSTNPVNLVRVSGL